MKSVFVAACLFLLPVALPAEQIQISDGYAAFYGDVDGDGVGDLLIRKKQHYAAVGVGLINITPIRSKAYLISGIDAGRSSIEVIYSNSYPAGNLSPAPIHFVDFDRNGELTAIILFPGAEFLAVRISSDGSGLLGVVGVIPRGSAALDISDRLQLELMDVSGNESLDIVIRAPETTLTYVMANDGDGGLSAPVLSLPHKGNNSLPPIIPNYIAGSSEIESSVSAGNSQVVVPINIAAGPAGITPSLSLVYSSGSEYGLAGMGFQLSGMSAISRCGSTYYHDGKVQPVKGSAEDYACLDGSRLVLVSGNYWEHGSHYRLEAEQFQDVVYSVEGQSGGYFKIFDKDGDIHTYRAVSDGSETSGEQALAGKHGNTSRWPLESVENRFGIGYRLIYQEKSAGLMPERMVYTTGLSQAPIGEVIFEYEQDGYWRHAYLDGRQYDVGYRISSITNRMNGDVYRSHSLFYDVNSETGKSLLTAIIECSYGNNCLRPLRLQWNKQQSYKFNDEKLVKSLDDIPAGEVFSSSWVDVDRDGADDYCHIVVDKGSLVEAGCYVDGPQGPLTEFINIDLSHITDVDLEKTAFDLSKRNLSNWNRDPSWIDHNGNGKIEFCYSYSRQNGSTSIHCLGDSESGEMFSVAMDYSFKLTFPGRPQDSENPLSNNFSHLTVFGSWVDVNGSGIPDFCFVSSAAQFKEDRVDQDNKLIFYKGKSRNFLGCIFQPSSPTMGGENSLLFVNGPVRLLGERSITVPLKTWAKASDFDFAYGYLLGKDLGVWSDLEGDGDSDFCRVAADKMECLLAEILVQPFFQSTQDADITAYKENVESDKPDPNLLSTSIFDFDGSGYADLCRIGKVLQGNQAGYQARCTLGGPGSWEDEITSQIVFFPDARSANYFDVNNDGWTDWCIERARTLECFLSDSGQFSHNWRTYFLGGPRTEIGDKFTTALVDLEGNGKVNYCISASSMADVQGGQFLRCLGDNSEAQSQSSDDISAVSNAYDVTYLFTYADGGYEEVYQKSAAMGDAGQILLPANGSRLVSKFEIVDEDGEASSSTYFYRDLGAFPAELGGVGFRYIRSITDNGKYKNETWFHQDVHSHKAGLVERARTSIVSAEGGYQILQETTNTWKTLIYSGTTNDASENYGVLNFVNGSPMYSIFTSIWNKNSGVIKRYSTHLESSVTKEYELDGALVSESRVRNDYDNFGNLISQSAVVSGADQQFNHVLENIYENEIEGWIIGRLKSAVAIRHGIYKGEAIPEQRRATAWQHYTSGPRKGMVEYEIIEPDKASLRKTTHYRYIDTGQIDSLTIETPDAESRTVSYEYDPSYRFAVREVNAAGHQVETEYHPVSGLPVKVRDANGLETRMEYDAIGRLKKTTLPGGQSNHVEVVDCKVSFCPNHAAYYTKLWSTSISGIQLAPARYVYTDSLGRTIESRTPGFNGDTISVLTEYDDEGDIARQSEPFFVGDTVYWNRVEAKDPSGRVTREQTADGLIVSTEYSGLTTAERRSWADGTRRTESELDVRGNLRRAVDAGGRIIHYRYDAFDNLLAVSLPDGTEQASTYDELGRRISHYDSSTGQWRYAYDGHDQLIVQQNGSGERTCFAYDVLGRRTLRTDRYLPGASWDSVVTQARSGCAGQEPTTVWRYDSEASGLGRVAQIVHKLNYREVPSYDYLGRPVAVSVEIDGQAYSAASTFDHDTGRLLVNHLPKPAGAQGVDIEHRYNEYGYLVEIGPINSDVYYWKIDDSDAHGNTVARSLSNGTILQQQITNPANGLTEQVRAKRALALNWDVQNERYEYNPNGIMLSREEQISGVSHIQEQFSYDGVDRLIENTITNMLQPGLSYTETTAYDSNGNISNRSSVGQYLYGQACEVNGVTYQPSGQAVTSVMGQATSDYCYDTAGQMISGAGRQTSYTNFGKPERIISDRGQVEFFYGPDRETIKQVTSRADNNSVTTAVRFGSYEHLVVNRGGEVTTKQTYSLGPVVLTLSAQDQTVPEESYLFSDVLGSINAVTDAFGQVTERHRYDPWGRSRGSLNWLVMSSTELFSIDRTVQAVSRGFTGHQMIDIAGVIHMGGRAYDPLLARFMSPDPVVGDTTFVDAYNRYSYVLNSPMSYTDPSGYIFSRVRKEVKRFARRVRKELSRFESRYRNEIRGILTLGIEPALRYGGKELSRFAARNKFAGQILGAVGVVGCSFTGPAAGGCVAAFQGATSAAISYGNGGKFEQALGAGLRSAAIGYANSAAAAQIGASTAAIKNAALQAASRGVQHAFRGAVFAGLAGGDFRSGFIGGAIEGAFGGAIRGLAGNNVAAGVAISGMMSGTVSAATGGNFWVGAEQGAFGYLFNTASDVVAGNSESGLFGSFKVSLRGFFVKVGLADEEIDSSYGHSGSNHEFDTVDGVTLSSGGAEFNGRSAAKCFFVICVGANSNGDFRFSIRVDRNSSKLNVGAEVEIGTTVPVDPRRGLLGPSINATATKEKEAGL